MGFYKLILAFLHILLSIRAIFLLAVDKLQTFVTGFFGARGKSKAEIDLHSRTSSGLPTHISFVILEQEISFTDVAHLIVWSMAMGISYISVYDRRGILKENAAKLSSEIIYKQREVFEGESKQYTFILRNGRTKFDPSLASTQVCISILSAEDGKQDIIEAAQDFCKAVEQKEKTPKHMDTTLLNDMLRATHGIPDPDLAIKFGSLSSVMGFLPWQSRLTEFLLLRTHQHIQFTTFLSTLQKYSKCEKRFGK